MDVISTAVLSIASSIVGNFVSRSFEEKTPTITRAEIKQEIKSAVLEHYSSKDGQFIKLVVQQVIQEIELISVRHPGISIDESALRSEPRNLSLLSRKKKRKANVQERLRKLQEIVEERRAELAEFSDISSEGLQGLEERRLIVTDCSTKEGFSDEDRSEDEDHDVIDVEIIEENETGTGSVAQKTSGTGHEVTSDDKGKELKHKVASEVPKLLPAGHQDNEPRLPQHSVTWIRKETTSLGEAALPSRLEKMMNRIERRRSGDSSKAADPKTHRDS